MSVRGRRHPEWVGHDRCQKRSSGRAVPLYRRVLTIKERVFEPDHPEIGVLLNNLAVMHRQPGLLDEALRHYVRALPLLQRTLGISTPPL